MSFPLPSLPFAAAAAGAIGLALGAEEEGLVRAGHYMAECGTTQIMHGKGTGEGRACQGRV